MTWKQRPPKGYMAAYDQFHGGNFMRGNYSSPEKLERNERIIDMHLAGVHYSEIAKQMGISPSRVRQIIDEFHVKQKAAAVPA